MYKRETPVIVNRAAGSVPANARQILDDLSDRFEVPLSVTECDPEQLETSLLKHCDRDQPIAVWGGDGTIAGALSKAGDNCQILPLPGGTMNLLHKHVHNGHHSVDNLLEQLSKDALIESEITKGEINGHPFYVGVMVGQLVELAKVREALRHQKPIKALRGLLSTETFDLSQNIKIQLRPGRRKTSAVAMAAFTDGEVENAFDVAVFNPTSLFSIASSALDALVNGWRHARAIGHEICRTITVDARAEQIAVTIDGELHHLRPPLNIKINPNESAKVLACPPS